MSTGILNFLIFTVARQLEREIVIAFGLADEPSAAPEFLGFNNFPLVVAQAAFFFG